MIFLTFPPGAPGAGFLSVILHFSSLRSFTALKVQLRKMACYLQGEPHDASLMAQRQPNFLKQRFSYEAFFYCVTPEINKKLPWERATQDEVQRIEEKQENQMTPPADAKPDTQKEQFVTKKEILHTLELIANEETWIFVTIDEKESKERLLKPGTRAKWTARSGFSLKIGNAGGIKLLFDGKEIGPLGEKGKVVKLRLPSVKKFYPAIEKHQA